MTKLSRLYDEQTQIHRLYQDEQYSINQLAKTYQVHPSTMNRFLRKTIGVRATGLSEKQKQALYEAYQSGYSRREIACRFHTDVSNVSRILLRDFGVQPEKNRNVSPFEALIPSFIADYQSGLSASQIASKYQTTHNTVLKHLRKYEESIRGLEESKRPTDLNLTFFHQLTPEKIKQLGQIWAIGSLKRNHEHLLVLTIETSRQNKLDTVTRGWLEPQARIIQHNNSGSSVLRVGSIALCEQFNAWGIRQTYPTCLSPQDPHFWEGYFSLKVGFHKRSLYIGLPKGFDPSFKEVLIDFLVQLGLSKDSLRSRQQGISIFKKSEVQLFLTAYPQLLDELPSEKQSDYWQSFTHPAT